MTVPTTIHLLAEVRTTPLDPARPFWVLEYVSKSSKRKDYDKNMVKYERRFKVPYYLLFQPEAQELTLYKHNGQKYVSVKPNEHGRYAIPELELEVAAPDIDPHIPSLFGVYPTTDWHERETYDFFGIVFDGHPALTRIEMPDDWEGHPQRKDYPLGGIPVEYHGAQIPPPDERRAYN